MMRRNRLFGLLLLVLSVSVLASCGMLGDDGSDEDVTAADVGQDLVDNADVGSEDVSGPCVEGESAGLFLVRIADDPENATLTDCNTNPGADIDGIVLVRPDGDEFYAESVEIDPDVAGNVCAQNDKDDVNTVLGEPDACVEELGCGCGEFGYPTNPECDCAGGASKYVGYYSLNGGAIIVTFADDAEILCGDQIVVYEMYNPDVTGSEEGYQVAYGDAEGNWIDQVDFGTGVGTVDVTWEW